MTSWIILLELLLTMGLAVLTLLTVAGNRRRSHRLREVAGLEPRE